MIPFKNLNFLIVRGEPSRTITNGKINANPGFTLTEVLLALAVLGIALTPIFGLQSNMVHALARITARVQRLFVAEDFLLQSRTAFLKSADEQSKQEKKIVDPSTTLVYEAKPVKEEGPFKLLPCLVQEETELFWQDGINRPHELFVSFVYKPRKKKS